MPVFIAKYNEHRNEIQESDLLGTIKIPRNLSQLTERLPAPQYEKVETEIKPELPNMVRNEIVQNQHKIIANNVVHPRDRIASGRKLNPPKVDIEV